MSYCSCQACYKILRQQLTFTLLVGYSYACVSNMGHSGKLGSERLIFFSHCFFGQKTSTFLVLQLPINIGQKSTKRTALFKAIGRDRKFLLPKNAAENHRQVLAAKK